MFFHTTNRPSKIWDPTRPNRPNKYCVGPNENSVGLILFLNTLVCHIKQETLNLLNTDILYWTSLILENGL